MGNVHYLSAPQGYSLGTADPSSLHYEQMRSHTIGNMTSDEIEKSLPEMDWAAEKTKFQKYQKHPDKNNPQALYGRLQGLDPDQAWNEVARRLWMRYYSNSRGGLYEGQIPTLELTGMRPIAAPEGSPGQGLMTGTGTITIGPPKTVTPKTTAPTIPQSPIPQNWLEQLATKGYVGTTAPQSVTVQKNYSATTPASSTNPVANTSSTTATPTPNWWGVGNQNKTTSFAQPPTRKGVQIPSWWQPKTPTSKNFIRQWMPKKLF